MQFTSEIVVDGVLEQTFEVVVADDTVTGVLWSPSSASGGRPLLLMGHGGSQHKKVPGILGRARSYVTAQGFAVAAIDAPGHGGRPFAPEVAALVATLRQRMVEREPIGELVARLNAQQAALAVPEWRATLDALLALENVGARAPVGYWGLSMGGAIGVSLTAREPRIRAAVFGLVGLSRADDERGAFAQAAAQVTVPLEFALQWDDQAVPREEGLALFNAFGAREKSLHANPGGHGAIPPFEDQSWERFFARHLS